MDVLYSQYWLVGTSSCYYPVSDVMARIVERALSRWPKPEWVRFVDLNGAVVRLRTSAIESVEQSSPEIRSLRRRFYAERDHEASADREW